MLPNGNKLTFSLLSLSRNPEWIFDIPIYKQGKTRSTSYFWSVAFDRRPERVNVHLFRHDRNWGYEDEDWVDFLLTVTHTLFFLSHVVWQTKMWLLRQLHVRRSLAKGTTLVFIQHPFHSLSFYYTGNDIARQNHRGYWWLNVSWSIVFCFIENASACSIAIMKKKGIRDHLDSIRTSTTTLPKLYSIDKLVFC